MRIALKPEMFENGRFFISYGNREALFSVVDEEFAGRNALGRINKINILVRKFTNTGKESDAHLCTPVIGIGDGIVGVHGGDSRLFGKAMTKDNMEQCVVELYEDE